MCSVDAPPPVEIERPTFVRNPFLDELRQDVAGASAARRGRSSLVIPTGDGIGFSGRGGTSGAGGVGIPQGNARRSGNRLGGSGGSASSGGGSTGIPTGGPRGRGRGGNHR